TPLIRRNCHGTWTSPGVPTVPLRTVWILVAIERFVQHPDAESGHRWRHVAAGTDNARILEVFVQMIHVLDAAIVQGGRQHDVIDHRVVLYVFAQADASRMWPHRRV